ncbi:helicase HerA-like domain-containing protein [Pendulispora albinea]|uniref:DUF853 family protein n=1 Tax=Pendulispora albinea TaxID=2741071 RepID=A0ABZ2LS75_9BACT
MSPTFSVTEVVTATRCPRQLVLAREGHRVVPYGPDAFGQAAHEALHAIATGAAEDPKLHALLGRQRPDPAAVEHALFQLALSGAHAHAKKVASHVDGADLARFADTVRHIAKLLTPPMVQASAGAANARSAVDKAFPASEETIELELDGATIRGRIDLLCRHAEQTWLWDLKTYAGTDLAQLEQVRLYAMAYAAKGTHAHPALVHVVRDRIQIDAADPPREGDAEKLLTLVHHMRSWLGGAPPPRAPDLETCRTCAAQAPCWRLWGRTLPDEIDVPKPLTTPPPSMVDVPAPNTERNGAPPAMDSSDPALPHEKSRETTPPRGKMVDPPPPGKPSASPARDPARTPEPLWIGADPKKELVRLQPPELMRHIAVFGASGSGKTYLAKAIAEEAILAGVPVLAFDVQGDILTLAEPLDDTHLEPALRARRDAYRDRADIRLLTPMSEAGLRISLNPLRFPSRDMGIEQSTAYSEAVAENLLAHVKIAQWRDHARAYLAERIREAMKKVSSLLIEDLIAGIANDEDLDDPLLDRNQREKLVKQLRLLTIGSKSLLFRLGRPLDLDALLTSPDPSKTPLNVLWLNGLGDQQNKESFVAMVLADLYGWMLRQRGGAPRVLLYFDEIGPYMPPHGEPASKKLLKRIFKEGRKYGVCGLFCTQNFTDVDYKVVAQANTVAIGRINASQEKKKAADALGAPPNFDVASAIDRLVGAPAGRFVMKRADQPPHWLQSRKLMTLHGPTWGEEEIRDRTSPDARAAWNQP